MQSEMHDTKPSKLFWGIGVVYLIWSFIGCSMYLVEHLMSDIAYQEAFGADLLAVRGDVAWWATSGYALGVWGGLLAILFYMRRQKICLMFFYASFFGAVIGHFPSIFDGRFRDLMGVGDWVFMLFIWLSCIFIIGYARKMLRAGIIR